MFIGVDASTICEEEIGTWFARNGGLDPSDWFGDGSEFESSNAGRGKKRSEDHVVARRNANDVVYAGVQGLHYSATGPAGP